jgi:hypothetical protein
MENMAWIIRQRDFHERSFTVSTARVRDDAEPAAPFANDPYGLKI